MYRKYIFILLIFSQVLVSKINAQKYSGGIPFLRNYSHEEYKGESQNFAVIQDDRGVMYFANNTSVLEFDGSGWRQIFIPGKPTIYSLGKSKSGRIYVGASKGELGYLYANEKGVMTYKSLRDKIPKTDKGDSFNYIREIVFTDDNKIIFVSSLQLFIYDGKKFTTINKEKSPDDLNRFVSSFKIGENLYIQERGKGLHRYKGNSSFEFVPGTEKFSSIWITGIFPTASDSLLFTTWSDKKYKFYNGKYSSDTLNSLLRSIYKNAKAKDSNYIMGLYDNGIVYTDDKLNIKKHISTTTGLQNNTIYSLFVDKHSNVWAGMSNGISIIH
ncbi:MAG: hypothetical protein U9N85_13370, partial [Bacteroidota bacterium]|nr:hypothetical protein [Bacteroidota bacterium]